MNYTFIGTANVGYLSIKHHDEIKIFESFAYQFSSYFFAMDGNGQGCEMCWSYVILF